MLDLPGHPLIDKLSLIGLCARLPIPLDVARLQAEVDLLPQVLWATPSGRIGVHRAASAIFLRGHAPAEGDLAIEDREPLSRLPYARELISRIIPSKPLRCLIARLPADAIIAPHTDQPPYFGKSIRIHVPIHTHPAALMYCGGNIYRMAEGEIWALNNSTVHAVWNQHPTASRTHLICDYLPSKDLLFLLSTGERALGRNDPEFESRLHAELARRQGLEVR